MNNNTEEDKQLLESFNRVKSEMSKYKAINYWECWVGVVLLLIGVGGILAGNSSLGYFAVLAGVICVQGADYKAKIGFLQYQLAYAYNNLVVNNDRIFDLEIVVDSMLKDTIVEVGDNEEN